MRQNNEREGVPNLFVYTQTKGHPMTDARRAQARAATDQIQLALMPRPYSVIEGDDAAIVTDILVALIHDTEQRVWGEAAKLAEAIPNDWVGITGYSAEQTALHIAFMCREQATKETR